MSFTNSLYEELQEYLTTYSSGYEMSSESDLPPSYFSPPGTFDDTNLFKELGQIDQLTSDSTPTHQKVLCVDELKHEPETTVEPSSEASSSPPREEKPRRRQPRQPRYFEAMTFAEFEKKVHKRAGKVLEYYQDVRRSSLVYLCCQFISGKCDYMSKESRFVVSHIKFRHKNETHPGYKITEFPGFKDRKMHNCINKPYSELSNRDPEIAKKVLFAYNNPKNTTHKPKVHICSLIFEGRCSYISMEASQVMRHIIRNHANESASIVKVVNYPGSSARVFYEYEILTYDQLKNEKPHLVEKVLKCYKDHNCLNKVHLCGYCDYFSCYTSHLRSHIKAHHPANSINRVFKIIKYPKC